MDNSRITSAIIELWPIYYRLDWAKSAPPPSNFYLVKRAQLISTLSSIVGESSINCNRIALRESVEMRPIAVAIAPLVGELLVTPYVLDFKIAMACVCASAALRKWSSIPIHQLCNELCIRDTNGLH